MSNRFTIGVPDLLIAIPPFVPVLAEVKDLGEVVDEFDRKLEITEKQAYEMKRFSEPYENWQHVYTPERHTAIILVGVKHKKKHRLVVLPRTADRLSCDYEEQGGWVDRAVGGVYNVVKLLEFAGVMKCRAM